MAKKIVRYGIEFDDEYTLTYPDWDGTTEYYVQTENTGIVVFQTVRGEWWHVQRMVDKGWAIYLGSNV
jgi:hypothetical protein